ncbi:hypothetical protein CC80DRAFT_500279 [Byssothecium circinans]|uniref:Uncharacterized protein n=1 Tax=Byssothecium circinans TaxID=147558 RepID=A0A6A5UG87_9PLEO|nr:hypothetical protein CC80DRAFT_500279 [Byssothecium circinans]
MVGADYACFGNGWGFNFINKTREPWSMPNSLSKLRASLHHSGAIVSKYNSNTVYKVSLSHCIAYTSFSRLLVHTSFTRFFPKKFSILIHHNPQKWCHSRSFFLLPCWPVSCPYSPNKLSNKKLLAGTLKLNEAAAYALIADPAQNAFRPVDLIAMFGVNETTVKKWEELNFNKAVIGRAQSTIDRYLDLPVASAKRESNEFEWTRDILAVRQDLKDALHEAQSILGQNQTANLDEASTKHSTVCAGKTAACELCFVGTSMIYLGASTGCAIGAVATTGASAGAPTPPALGTYATYMTTTTSTFSRLLQNAEMRSSVNTYTSLADPISVDDGMLAMLYFGMAVGTISRC